MTGSFDTNKYVPFLLLSALWDFDLVGTEVHASLFPYSRKGDVNAWLSSEVFNLKEPSSVPAEEALERARAFLREVASQPTPLTAEQQSTLAEIDSALRGSLSDVDSFWIRWSHFREQKVGGA